MVTVQPRITAAERVELARTTVQPNQEITGEQHADVFHMALLSEFVRLS